MLYITGDTHGKYDFDKLAIFAKENPCLTKNDYMLIAGDFGGLWNPNTVANDLLFYDNLPFSILFIDGNHENFDLLNSYPTEIWNGGKIHRITDNIIHLMRGQIFTIEGKTIFTFGGATSIDRYERHIGIGWWEQEMPTYEELDEAIKNLKQYQNTVDLIITHTIDERTLYYPQLRINNTFMRAFPDNQMLSNFQDTITYKHWYFGHYHIDAEINENKTALYQNIVQII